MDPNTCMRNRVLRTITLLTLILISEITLTKLDCKLYIYFFLLSPNNKSFPVGMFHKGDKKENDKVVI